MPRTIRVHLDENRDPRIATGLRLRLIDITTTLDAGLLHAPDEAQHAYALQQGRVIITQDTDFLRINASEMEHAGIVFFPSQERSIGQVVCGIILI